MSNDSQGTSAEKDLEIILEHTRNFIESIDKEPQRVKDIFKESGRNNCFDGREISDEELKEQLKKIFLVSVAEAGKKVEPLVTQANNTKALNDKLRPLLKINDKQLSYYFSKVSFSVPEKPSFTSPVDLAKLLTSNASDDVVKNIIENQFKIQWDTPTGEPNDYTFYKFYDQKNTKKHFNYKLRQAHINATLYKECKRKDVSHLRQMKKEELCPTVFIKTSGGWKSWKADSDIFDTSNIISDCSWIKPPILKYINENANKQSVENLQESLKKPTLYWAVIKDNDFNPGNELQLSEIGETQVYVGKAVNGIKGRWLNDGANHCKKMEKCLGEVCDMATYKPFKPDDYQVVDARLALAKIREEKNALFVMEIFCDDSKNEKNDVLEAEKSCRQAKEKLRKARKNSNSRPTDTNAQEREGSSPQTRSSASREDDEIKKLEAEVKEQKKHLDEVKSKANNKLTEAEELHKKGKRQVDGPNIINIPNNESEIRWEPINMRFGMNGK